MKGQSSYYRRILTVILAFTLSLIAIWGFTVHRNYVYAAAGECKHEAPTEMSAGDVDPICPVCGEEIFCIWEADTRNGLNPSELNFVKGYTYDELCNISETGKFNEWLYLRLKGTNYPIFAVNTGVPIQSLFEDAGYEIDYEKYELFSLQGISGGMWEQVPWDALNGDGYYWFPNASDGSPDTSSSMQVPGVITLEYIGFTGPPSSGTTTGDYALSLDSSDLDSGFSKMRIIYGTTEEDFVSSSGTSVMGHRSLGGIDGLVVVLNTEYTVTFESNGGSNVDDQIVKKGYTATEPTDPTRSSYDFEGWYTDSELTNKWDFENDTVTEDTTLYAKWTEHLAEVTYIGTGDESVKITEKDVEKVGSKTTKTMVTRKGETSVEATFASVADLLENANIDASSYCMITLSAAASEGKSAATLDARIVDLDKVFIYKDGSSLRSAIDNDTKLYGMAWLSNLTTISASEHSYDEGEVTKEPTYTEKGIKTYTCTATDSHGEACGDTKTEDIPTLPSIKYIGTGKESILITDQDVSDVGTEDTKTMVTKKGESKVTATFASIADLLENAGIDASSYCKIRLTASDKSVLDTNIVDLDKVFIYKDGTSLRSAVDGGAGMTWLKGLTTVSAVEHTWDSGKVTKEPTTTAEGEKTYTCTVCGETKTESIPKLTPSDDSSKTVSTSKPVVVAKAVAKGKKSAVITWNKVSGADRYVIYYSTCNGKKNYKKAKTVSGKTSFTKTGLKAKTKYKFYVEAQKKVNGKYTTLATSKLAHMVTGNVKGKYTNPKNLTIDKKSANLSVGKTVKIKGTVSKVKSGKKLMTSHAAKLRFVSDNPTVASVNSSGKVTAKSTGNATIYVQTINGIWKTCKVTVK